MGPKIVSLNLKGLNSPHKRRALQKEILYLQGDIIFIQETHFLKHSPPKLLLKHFSQIFTANAEKKKAGVLIAIRDSINFQLKASLIDDKRRFIVLICDINDVTYTLVNVYTPNIRPTMFLNKLLKQITKCRQGHLIIGGDFNAVADPSIDTTAKSRRSSTCLNAFFLKHGLFDIWRCHHAGEEDYPFFSTSHRS